MVYGIVKQSEGEILVYSEEGRGTTFKIYFPRVEAKADSVRTTVVGGELTRGTETILVAEDEELLRRLVVRILSALGHKVLFTSGYTDDAIVRHGVLEAGTPFIQKPFSASDLAVKVRKVLDAAAAR
jgi:two-component system cell cycle sensor histidine kinase/response regulator CckA